MNIDGQASTVLNNLYSSGDGAVAWMFDPLQGNDVDNLANSNGTLNSYGQEVAALIKQNA